MRVDEALAKQLATQVLEPGERIMAVAQTDQKGGGDTIYLPTAVGTSRRLLLFFATEGGPPALTVVDYADCRSIDSQKGYFTFPMLLGTPKERKPITAALSIHGFGGGKQFQTEYAPWVVQAFGSGELFDTPERQQQRRSNLQRAEERKVELVQKAGSGLLTAVMIGVPLALLLGVGGFGSVWAYEAFSSHDRNSGELSRMENPMWYIEHGQPPPSPIEVQRKRDYVAKKQVDMVIGGAVAGTGLVAAIVAFLLLRRVKKRRESAAT